MISIPSLKQLCIHSINWQVGQRFHQIPYENVSELRGVARKCFECFCIFQTHATNSTKFKQTFSALFGEISDNLAPKTFLALKTNFDWVAEILDLADPSTFSLSLAKLNRAVVARLYHAAMQILLLNGHAAQNYVFSPHRRDFLLQEQRKAISTLNIAPTRTPFFAFEFFIHLELEYFELLHSRDYKFAITEDHRALRSLFQVNPQLYTKYQEMLSQCPVAVAEALKLGQIRFDDIEVKFRNVKDIALAAVKQDGMVLASLGNELNADREIVLAAVKNAGNALKYASRDCRADREIVFFATENRSEALRFAEAGLSSDFHFISSIVSCRGMALEFASSALRDNHHIVLQAVKNHGGALQFASNRLRADKEIVLPAAQCQGSILRFAAANLFSDHQIIMAAVSNWADALQFADPELCKCSDIVTTAINLHGTALAYADEAFRADRQLVLKAVSTAGRALQFASADMRDDREIVLKALADCADALEFASDRLRDDREIIYKAMDQDAVTAMHFASDRLRNEPEVIMRADHLIYVQERLWDLFVMHMPGRIWQYGI